MKGLLDKNLEEVSYDELQEIAKEYVALHKSSKTQIEELLDSPHIACPQFL